MEGRRLTLEFDRRQEILMGRDGVDTLPLTQVPHLTGVIPTSCCHIKAAEENLFQQLHTNIYMILSIKLNRSWQSTDEA